MGYQLLLSLRFSIRGSRVNLKSNWARIWIFLLIYWGHMAYISCNQTSDASRKGKFWASDSWFVHWLQPMQHKWLWWWGWWRWCLRQLFRSEMFSILSHVFWWFEYLECAYSGACTPQKETSKTFRVKPASTRHKLQANRFFTQIFTMCASVP